MSEHVEFVRPDDPRLALANWPENVVGYEAWDDDALYIVVGRNADPADVAEYTARFGVEVPATIEEPANPMLNRPLHISFSLGRAAGEGAL